MLLHVVRCINHTDQFQTGNPIANTMLYILSEHNNVMLDALCRYLQIIGIVGTEYAFHLYCPFEVVDVTITQGI